MGNVWLVVVACIPYSCSSRSNVKTIGDLVQAWYLSLGRWNEPPYLVGFVGGDVFMDLPFE